MENTQPNINLPRNIAVSIYILYIASVFIPPLSLIGVVFAYIFENDGKGYLESHYVYLIRTFWIGLLYFTISTIAIPVIIGFVLLFLSIIWWLIRVTKGFKDILQNNPVAKPRTWKF